MATERLGQEVAQAGDIKAMQWLLGHGGWWRPMFLENAAAAGQLAFLQWALNQIRFDHFPWWNRECLPAAAARGGHLHVVQWLRQHGWPWSDSTCSAAARGGYLELLQWAMAHGCPWNSQALWDHGMAHSEIVGWFQEQRLQPFPDNFQETLIWSDNMPLLVWALKQGFDRDRLRRYYLCYSRTTRFFRLRRELASVYHFQHHQRVRAWMTTVEDVAYTSVLPAVMPTALRDLVLTYC